MYYHTAIILIKVAFMFTFKEFYIEILSVFIFKNINVPMVIFSKFMMLLLLVQIYVKVLELIMNLIIVNVKIFQSISVFHLEFINSISSIFWFQAFNWFTFINSSSCLLAIFLYLKIKNDCSLFISFIQICFINYSVSYINCFQLILLIFNLSFDMYCFL